MLELENVTFEVAELGARKKILNNINLKIADWRLVVVTGPNGSGKSTLAKIIMGILQPTSGRIFFDGMDITDKSITERARLGLAFSFQQPVQIKGVTVFDLIEIAAQYDLVPDDVAKYLEKVGFDAENYLNRELDSGLSGGELKRIEIASVLARQAKFMVFDEPEAGIDLWSFDNLTKVFQKMRRENTRRTMVVISHQERILKIADEIILLKNGSIVRHAPAPELLPQIFGRNKDEV